MKLAFGAAAVVGTAALLSLSAPASAAFNYWLVSDTLSTPPALMSQTGLYTNITTKKMTPEARLFDVNSPLWSDGSHKKRWVIVPPGKKIGFKEKDDYFDYPDSTVFVKEFRLDSVPGDTTSRKYWETRFLVLKKRHEDPTNAASRIIDTWYGFSYKWRPDQKEADLVSMLQGQTAAFATYPNGKNNPPVMKKWFFPAQDMCWSCHRVGMPDSIHGRSVLGFFTAQLNHPHPANPSVNQLDSLFSGPYAVLGGAKPASWSASPRWYAVDDNSATLDQRARSYIAANCSGCHGTRGMATGAPRFVPFNYDYHDGQAHIDYRYTATSYDWGLDSLAPASVKAALVVPKYPQKSVLLFRQTQRNVEPFDSPTGYDTHPLQMPPLATYEVNTAAVNMLTQWILAMDTAQAGARPRALASDREPRLMGRLLLLPRELAKETRVGLIGVDGRAVVLRRLEAGLYAVPQGAPKGIYIIRVGARSFTRYLL